MDDLTVGIIFFVFVIGLLIAYVIYSKGYKRKAASAAVEAFKRKFQEVYPDKKLRYSIYAIPINTAFEHAAIDIEYPEKKVASLNKYIGWYYKAVLFDDEKLYLLLDYIESALQESALLPNKNKVTKILQNYYENVGKYLKEKFYEEKGSI